VGSGFKTFSPGDVLTASDVNNFLMEQSVMSFADSAARTSAIGTANFEEGMVAYLQDTKKIQVYNGTAWVDAANNTGAGLIHIETVSFSGATAHSFGSDANPIFTSNFRNYKIILENLNSTTTDANLNIRLRDNVTDFSTSVYNFQTFFASSTTLTGARNNGQPEWGIARISFSRENSAIVDLFGPQLAINTSYQSHNMYDQDGVGPNVRLYYGRVASTTAFNGFSILASSNISGTMSVYGYKI